MICIASAAELQLKLRSIMAIFKMVFLYLNSYSNCFRVFFFLSCLFFAKNTMCCFNWEAHIITIVGGFVQIRQNNVYVLVSRFKAFSGQAPFFKKSSLFILEKSKHKCYTDIWFSYQSHLPPNLILNEVCDSCIKVKSLLTFKIKSKL